MSRLKKDLERVKQERAKITKEDIYRNLKLYQEDKALDIPLIYLDGKLKNCISRRAQERKEYNKLYRDIPKNKEKKAKLMKKYYEKKKLNVTKTL